MHHDLITLQVIRYFRPLLHKSPIFQVFQSELVITIIFASFVAVASANATTVVTFAVDVATSACLWLLPLSGEIWVKIEENKIVGCLLLSFVYLKRRSKLLAYAHYNFQESMKMKWEGKRRRFQYSRGREWGKISLYAWFCENAWNFPDGSEEGGMRWERIVCRCRCACEWVRCTKDHKWVAHTRFR